jgi:hypothetical protein
LLEELLDLVALEVDEVLEVEVVNALTRMVLLVVVTLPATEVEEVLEVEVVALVRLVLVVFLLVVETDVEVVVIRCRVPVDVVV